MRPKQAHLIDDRQAFTVVELLVVIAIVVLLIAITLVTLSPVRSAARDIQCANNMRQISMALVGYANQNRGCFPPNSSELGQFWYSRSSIASYQSAPESVGRAGDAPGGVKSDRDLAGGVLVCPNDLQDSVRSYSMNLFASGVVSKHVEAKLEGANPPGHLFRLGKTQTSSSLLLLLESWPELPINGEQPLKFAAQAVIGLVGKPGQRFGGGTGVVWTDPKDATAGRFDVRASQITFYRHRMGPGSMFAPDGRANFAFVDGHVELLEQRELVGSDGKSSYRAMWSANDRVVDGQ